MIASTKMNRISVRVVPHLAMTIFTVSGILSGMAFVFAGGIAGTDLPERWGVTDLGAVRRPGEVRYDAATKAFSLRSIGEVTEQCGTFAFTRVKGDFVATVRVTAASQKSVGAGLMVRTSTNAEARFLKNAFNGFRFGNGPAMTARQTDGVSAWQPGDITHVQTLPCWVRIIRHRDSVASYYSGDGKEWNLMHFGGVRFNPGLPEELLVGVVNAQHDSDELESATLDNFSLDPPVKLPYVTSWLGNSFASQYYQGHVQMQIRAMCIQPGPKPLLRVTGQSEALDSSVFDLEGNLLHMYQLEGSGGEAIASDGAWMFEVTGGSGAGRQRLDRFPVALDRIGKAGSDTSQTRSALARSTLTGVATRNGRVYVADAGKERVVVLDAATLAEVATFSTPRPGALALGKDETLWVVQRPGWQTNAPLFEVRPGPSSPVNTEPAQVLCYGLDGLPRPERTVRFDEGFDRVIPDKIAVHPATGALYVCDVGRSQCVWIFDAQGRTAGRFGELGGVYQGKVPGRVDAAHLYFPRAITFDDTGCLYLAMVPRTGWVGGTLLRKYDPAGKKVLWERQGLEFQEAADGDPGTDGVDVFTQTHRYTMDFSKGPGQEAVYSALTFDPFTYPEDPRNANHGGAVNASAVRRIGGQRVLFLHDWPRNGEIIYRFNAGSEIAIPCGKVGNSGLWIDRNGDGRADPDELGPKLPFGQCWTVDANGDIWSCGAGEIRCWRNEGLNAHGAPIYPQAPTEIHAAPGPLTEASHVIYDAVLDRLFVGGFTRERRKAGSDHGGSLGAVLMGFSNVRASKGLGQRRWQRDLPYETGTEGLGNEANNFFCASYAGDAKGGYLFIGGLSERGVKKSSIWAIDPKTGEMVQRFLPGPEVAGYCAWFDFNNAINAMKRKDGEYILFAEDDGAQKVNLFRWQP